MFEWWPAVVFGWPAIMVAVGLSVAGIVRKKPKWLVVAAIIVIPFSFYLAGSPKFRWVGLMFPLLLGIAAIAVKRDRIPVAWLLLAPFVGVSGWLAVIVMSQ